MSLEDWNRVIAVNLTGQFLRARAAVRQFCKRGVDAARSAAAGKKLLELIPYGRASASLTTWRTSRRGSSPTSPTTSPARRSTSTAG